MLGRIVKLYVFSRLPKKFIPLYIFDFLLIAVACKYHTSVNAPFSIIIVSVLTLLSMFTASKLFLLKSDLDFLLTIPVEEKEIVVAILLGSFILLTLTFGIIIWILLALSFGLYGLIITPLIMLLSTSLAPLRKVVSYPLVLLWFLSALMGFPISPLSGSLEGATTLALTSLLIFLIAVNRVSLNIMSLSYTDVVKSTISFKPRHRLLVMLTKDMNILSFGIRTGIVTIGNVVTIRIRLWKAILVSTALGILVFLLNYFGVGGVYFFPGCSILVDFYVQLFLVILLFSFSVLFSLGSLVGEPIWLDLNVMDVLQFFRYYILSKVLVFILLILPIVVAEAVSGLTRIAVAIVLMYPLDLIPLISASARMQGTSFTNVLIGLLFVVVSLINIVGTILLLYYPTTTIWILSIQIALSLPFLFWRSYWQGVVEKAIKSESELL